MKGLVQGVGFRPFVYRLAKDHALDGWVKNAGDGVYIRLQGDQQNIDAFLFGLQSQAPIASTLESISTEESKADTSSGFTILKSDGTSTEITQVSPDIAVCPECLADMKRQAHRLDYPFVNCTHCGPRFSIIRDLPYDRERTAMDVFPMCSTCKSEYTNIEDRRFHAQPVACNTCGPRYRLHMHDAFVDDLQEMLTSIAALIDQGGIVAVKGMGGFFLMCDALNEEAVHRLRNSKLREGKPFAVMFRDIDSAARFTIMSQQEMKAIQGWQRPIVLLRSSRPLAPSVCSGFPTVGAMLPYMPIHYMLFEKLKQDVVVLTSGNLSDEPIVTGNREALEILGEISDAVLTYNRDIHNRVDDSVSMVVNGESRIIRRSRGYAPSPLFLNAEAEGIFAAGAELTNCFCMGKGRQAILSQHIGDLKNFETYEFYLESVSRFQRLFRVAPAVAACDLHPDYLSSAYARDMGIPVFEVQHHHAHVASCMAEHGLTGKVIGIAFDGTGYGTDGTIWGSEFMVADYLGFERKAHLEYIPMPGGDSVTKEPWRTAVSLLYKIYGKEIDALPLDWLRKIDPRKKRIIIESIDRKINCPPSCSAGRWFDALAAITGICVESSFHAEAPMRLEAAIDPDEQGLYPWTISEQGLISLEPSIRTIVEDVLKGVKASVISARFHRTILQVISHTVMKIAAETGINQVAISGGTFQNRFLLENLLPAFENSGLKIFIQSKVPSNDGGIALGQLAVAAERRNSVYTEFAKDQIPE